MKRTAQSIFVALLTGVAVFTGSLPALASSTTTVTFTTPPTGGVPSPGFTLDTTLGVPKPGGSNVYRLVMFVLGPAPDFKTWNANEGLGANCVVPKTNPTASDMASCGISSFEVARNGTDFVPLALTKLSASFLFDFEWAKDDALIDNGSKFRVTFLPGAFMTKTGTDYSVTTKLNAWCVATDGSPPCNAGIGANGEWTGSTSSSSLFDVLAAPAPPPPSGGSSNSSPAIHLDLQAKPGDTVSGAPVVTGAQGLKPGSTYTLVLREPAVTLRTGVAGASGGFSFKDILPAGLAPGIYTITLTAMGADGSTLVLTQSFTIAANGTFSVVGPVTGKATASLAATGVDGPLALGAGSVAALLVVLGAVLVIARRRAEVLQR